MCTRSFLLCVGLKSPVRTVVPVAGVVLVVQVEILKSQPYSHFTQEIEKRADC